MIADARRARTSLTLLLCGVPLVVVDVRIGLVDLVPDVIGLVLVAVALIGLLSQTGEPEAVRWLRTAAILAVVALPVSMLADLDVPVHAFWRLTELALDLAGLVITCIGMEELAAAAALARSHEAWSQARWVAVAFVGVLLGAMLLAPFVYGPLLVLVASGVGLGALAMFLLATWRTRAEIA